MNTERRWQIAVLALFVGLLQVCPSLAANTAPSQPTFNVVPSPAKLYPYTAKPNPDPNSIAGPYTVKVDYTDPDGGTNLQHVYLQIKGDGAAQTIQYFNLTTPQQWAGEGDHLYNIAASKTAIANGYRVTFTFQIKNTWAPSKNVDLDAWGYDKSSVEGTHRAYDWNGIYDNGLKIVSAQKTSLVDNDGDGYYSSVKIEADADTAVASRTVKLILYRRDSAVGGSGANIWDTGNYTTSGSGADYKGTTCAVTTKSTYDFAWELYDPDWYITNRWYDATADISNIKMEPASEDIAASAPDQPSFSSVPSAAKLYPFTARPSPDPDSISGPYTVVVDYTDANGASDLQHVYLQIKGDGVAQTIQYFNMTTPQQWAGEGDHLYNIAASKTAIANGYRVTFTFQIKNTWAPSKNVDFDAWGYDKGNVDGTHRAYNWNGIYDNGLKIASAQKTSLVDNDGDGYYSSVKIEADADTAVASRTVKLILYRRDSAVGGSGANIWDTGNYTTSGSGADYKGTACAVTSKSTYDFAWELYDPDWYITNRWYDAIADISNIKMEPASEDVAPGITPVPVSPSDNAIVASLVPGFEWSAFSGSGQTQAGYQMRVRRDTPKAWSFDESRTWGVPPSGWVDESSDGSAKTYRNTTFDGSSCLQIKTTGGTGDRVKVRTLDLSREGIYDWRIYIPAINEPGAASSIGAFLYSPESSGDLSAREVDFEIGYGKAGERAAYAIPAGKLMCYMTLQRDDSTGTAHSTHAVPIDPAAWYTFRLVLSLDANSNYVVQWFIRKEGQAFVESRPSALCAYGRLNTTFCTYASVENLPFIGDSTPSADKEAYFDVVSIYDTIVYDTGFIADASAKSHQYSPGAHSGVDPISGAFRVSEPLLDQCEYHWHVRYRGSTGVWTAWSADSVAGQQNFGVVINDPPTDISLSNVAIAENQPSGTVIGTLSTTDPDTGGGFTYSLVSGAGGTDNASFTINGSALQAAAVFDYETKGEHAVRVRATDQGGLWYEEAFTITVNNVNEAPVDISLSKSTIAENQPSGTVIGTLSTTDPDAGGGFTYSLVGGVGGADNASFTINGSTLQAAAVFDYETKSDYTVRIRTTDQGSMVFEKSLGLGVLDIDERPVMGSMASAGHSGVVFRWSSVVGETYAIHSSTNLLQGFSVIASNLPAFPPQNVFTVPVWEAKEAIWRVMKE